MSISVIVKSPKDAIAPQQTPWSDLEIMSKEHQAFCKILENHGSSLQMLPRFEGTKLNSVFTHEPALFLPKGAIILQPPKRREEAPAAQQLLVSLGIPILGNLSFGAHCDGGDIMWVDPSLVVIGRTRRTNAKGVQELRELLVPLGVEVLEVHLPCSNRTLHLHSVVSMIDTNLAIGYLPLLPIPLMELFESRNIKFIEVPGNRINRIDGIPDSELDSGASNVLAFKPRELLIMTGNPISRSLLEKEGCKVEEWNGDEIAKKGGGGPKCLCNGYLFTHYFR